MPEEFGVERSGDGASEDSGSAPLAREQRPDPAWLIRFDDPFVGTEVFTGEGAEESARSRFAELLINWSVTLFRSVDPEALNATGACECPTRAALLFVKTWFAELEGRGDEEDPLTAMRRKFHAPVHAAIDAALVAPCPCAGMREQLEELQAQEALAWKEANASDDKVSLLHGQLLQSQAEVQSGKELLAGKVLTIQQLRAQLTASQERERALREALVLAESWVICDSRKNAAVAAGIREPVEAVEARRERALSQIAKALATPEGVDRIHGRPSARSAGMGPEHLSRIGRNDPCPCGSGKKLKRCCGTGDAAR